MEATAVVEVAAEVVVVAIAAVAAMVVVETADAEMVVVETRTATLMKRPGIICLGMNDKRLLRHGNVLEVQIVPM